jgi:Gpi18-like mannosyltransferase
MITGILAALTRGGAIVGAIFLVVALLEQLVVAFGLLIAIIKLAIIVIFVAVIVLIAVAIYRDRKKYKVTPDI